MKYIVSLLLILITTSLLAQTPQGLSYQAVAFNTSGNPVSNGTVGVKISILDNSANGPVVYEETHTETTNTQGLFSLNIGQGSATTGTFSSINWGMNSKFLKVEVDPNGGTNYTIAGTNQFMSVPYALYAENVANTANNSTPNTSSLNNNLNTSFAFEAFDDNIMYAWGPISGWVGQSYSDTASGASNLIASGGNFAFEAFDDNTVNAWSFITGQWASASYQETASGASSILESSGNFAFNAFDENKIYAWSAITGQWTSVSYVETASDASSIIASNGNFAFEAFDEDKMYAWSALTGQWTSVGYSDTASGASNLAESNGNFIFEAFDDNLFYVWNAFTGQWTSQSYSNSASGASNIISSPQN